MKYNIGESCRQIKYDKFDGLLLKIVYTRMTSKQLNKLVGSTAGISRSLLGFKDT